MMGRDAVATEGWWDAIEPARTAFFLDVDGTLLGFEDHPGDVVADAALLRLLERLRAAAGGALALVSGRMIADLDRIVAPLTLPAGGVHGAELRLADGREETGGGTCVPALRAEAEAYAARWGLWVEAKGATTFAVHYRRAPEREGEVLAFLDDLVAGHELMVQAGKMVAEVKPVDLDKGTAVARLMATAPFAGRMPLFLGDDLTDEHGFEAVLSMGGVAIKVGEGATRAPRHLADTDAVRAFLEHLCRGASTGEVTSPPVDPKPA